MLRNDTSVNPHSSSVEDSSHENYSESNHDSMDEESSPRNIMNVENISTTKSSRKLKKSDKSRSKSTKKFTITQKDKKSKQKLNKNDGLNETLNGLEKMSISEEKSYNNGDDDEVNDNSLINQLKDQLRYDKSPRDEVVTKKPVRSSILPTQPPSVVNHPQEVDPPRRAHDKRKEILLDDDELFDLGDNLVRRRIYKPLDESGKVTNKKIKNISCFNFTIEHFEEGATQWYHLKEPAYNLLSSVFDALSFSTGKKAKCNPLEKIIDQEKKKGLGRSKRKRVEDDSSSDVPEKISDDVEKNLNNESKYILGKDDIHLCIETLLRESTVYGYRIWVIDTYVETKYESDLLSLGLKESLLEARNIQELAKKQLATIQKNPPQRGGPAKAKKGPQKTYRISKEYSFTNYYPHDKHFLGLLKTYFYKDPSSITTENLEYDDNEDKTQTSGHSGIKPVKFRDNRAFFRLDTLDNNYTDVSPIQLKHDYNITSLFSKEVAMIYHVHSAKINEDQCRLENYFGNCTNNLPHIYSSSSPDDGNKNHCDMAVGDIDKVLNRGPNAFSINKEYLLNRLINSFGKVTPNDHFSRFPHQNITYVLDNTFLSQEFIDRMPLPHRIGTTLYTQEDTRIFKNILRTSYDYVDEREMGYHHNTNDEETSIYSRKNVSIDDDQFSSKFNFYGLHQTEYALTSEILINNIHHIDIKHRNSLNSSTISKDIKNKFIENKLNEINSRLKIVISNIGYKGRILISEDFQEGEDILLDNKVSKLELSDGSCTSIMNSNNHYMIDEDESNTGDIKNNISHKPYISRTPPSIINNKNKINTITKKAKEYARSIKSLSDNPILLKEKEEDEEKDRESKLASGFVGYFKETLEEFRPFDNSLISIKKNKSNTRVEHVFLARDKFLCLNEFNQDAWAVCDAKHYDPVTGKLPVENEEAYFKDVRRLHEAMTVECLHEILTSDSVSLACLGIRSDLLKQPLSYLPVLKRNDQAITDKKNKTTKRKRIGIPLPIFEHTQELRPYGAFRAYVHGFISDQGGITYNYKTIALLYFCKLHHCRWHPECNDPKLNVILSGNGMAGKSKALQFTKKTCPTGVGDMITHITDQAFNVDRNLNDMLLIYEEFQNKYLGFSANSGAKNTGSGNGGGGGVSSGNDKDTTNFFKARLTSGKTMTMSWFENEETGKRDMKVSQAHCQGSLMGATNNDLSEADANVLSRLILISVPKSKNAIAGYRPQDRNKPTYGNDQSQNEKMFEQHREIHRVYYIVEQMIKSGVLRDDKYGANVDGARIMITAILDQLQLKYGIQTNDIRKRDHVLELARCMCLANAVHFGLTSSITRYLQYDPETGEYIGFNPRVLIDGIFPFLVVVKDMVFDAVTSLSCLWYHEYQDLILEVFATQKCKLHELRESDFLVKNRNDKSFIQISKKTRSSITNGGSGGGGSLLSSSGSNSGMGFNSNFGNYGGGSKQQEDIEVDYNYITISGAHKETLYLLSISLGQLIVSLEDIGKLLRDLEKSYIETDGYEMYQDVAEDGTIVRKLVRSKETRKTRKVVEFSYSQVTGKPTISILVQFLKQKLPNILGDNIIEDLSKDNSTWIESEEILIKKREQERIEYNEKKKQCITIDDDYGEEKTADMDLLYEEVDEEEEKETEASQFYKKVRKIGKIGDRTETSIIKSIKDIMQNSVLEATGLTKEEEKNLSKCYMNPITKEVPWMSYITADHPKQIKITDIYPELNDKVKNLKEPTDKDILFVDKLLVLDLERKDTGNKFIITNYNTVSPSTKESLSIYQNACNRLNNNEIDTEKTLTKKRIDKYTKTDTWELDYDIDFIFCQEHLRNLGFKALKSKPGYSLINYPPCTYMAVIEDKRNRMKENGIDPTLVGDMLNEYPLYDNMTRITTRKKKINGEIDPLNTKHKPFSNFMTSDYDKESNTKKNRMIISDPTKRLIENEKKRKLENIESMMSNKKKKKT